MNVINVTSQLLPGKPLIPLDLDNVVNIVLHHPEAINCTWEEINQWHKAQGWSCAGYNEFITKAGDVYILRGDNIGAQCQGHNSTSYGICCEGNYNKELLMPDVQKKALIERIKFNRDRFKNYKATVPHWYYTDTICPGKYFPISEILKRVEVKEMTFNEAMQVLIDNKIITNEAYWRCAADCVMFLKELIINFAKKIVELKG